MADTWVIILIIASACFAVWVIEKFNHRKRESEQTMRMKRVVQALREYDKKGNN
jgi:positive regulator of sigma E activity